MSATSFHPLQSAFREGFKAGSRGGQSIDAACEAFSGSSTRSLLESMLAVAPSPPPWSAEQVDSISAYALDFYNSAERPADTAVERAQRIINDMVSELVYQLGETGDETEKLIKPDEIRIISEALATVQAIPTPPAAPVAEVEIEAETLTFKEAWEQIYPSGKPSEAVRRANELLLSITGREGGSPRINWYLLRNRIADALSQSEETP